jgi:hypothetical protein
MLADPDNYAMAATGRLMLSHATALRAYIQADDLSQLPATFRGWGPAKGPRRRRCAGGDAEVGGDAGAAAGTASEASAVGGGSGGGSGCGVSAALQLKQQLVDGYELTAHLALNEPSLDGVRPSVNTPLRLSVDVGPRPTQRLGPLLYRVGAHGVLAPATVDGSGGGGGGGASVLAAHMQGALALAGNATLWQAPNKPWQGRSKRGAAGPAFRAPLPPPALPPVPSSERLPPLPAGDAGGRAGGLSRARSAASDAAEDDGGAGGAARRHPPKPRRARAGDGREAGPPLVTPGQVQDGLQETTWRLERLRTDLQDWASRARAGELLKSGRAKKRAGRPGGCWSSVLPPPGLRVGGLVGVLGRVPLHHARFDAPRAPQHDAAAGGGGRRRRRAAAAAAAPDADGALTPRLGDGGGSSSSSAPAAWLRNLGSAGRGFMEHVVFGGLSGLGGFGSHLAHDVGVRLFASGGASLQLGSMRRSLLDFTRLEATVDLGLTGPKVGAAGGPGGERAAGARHPAFALDGTGAWHALTLSACQQVVGPVRVRADWRLALDSAEPLPMLRGGPSGSAVAAPQAAASQLARHVAGMRPSLLDAAYGLDVVLPGSGGLLRGVVWYSPRRAEGGIELRLL